MLACSGCYSGLHDGPAGGGAADAGLDDDDDAGDGAGRDDGDDGDDGEDDGAAQDCDTLQVGLSPLRRLTRLQYRNAVRDLLGVDVDVDVLPEDERADAVGAFASNVLAPISENSVRDYQNAAEQTLELAIASGALDAAIPCDPIAIGEDACAAQFIAEFGRRALRHPLSAADQADFEALFAEADPADAFAERIALVAETMLQLPDFLYLIELGTDDAQGDEIVVLTDDELASRLSFFLWSSTPDDALLDAAEAGALQTPAGLAEQAERLLADERSRDAIASFHTQWLGIHELPEADKSPVYFPNYDAALGEAMMAETEAFTDYVLREDDGTLATLLTASYTVAEPRLLELYGVDPTTTDGDGVTALPPTERAGLLTHASVMASHAHADQASVVQRGVLVRRNFTCMTLPPPPPDVDVDLPEPDPDQSTRERFNEHSDNPACSGCHTLIDPIGFGLLAYDGIGKRIEEDGGQPIDESGKITGIGEEDDGSFYGPVELAARLADSQVVRRCVARQWTTFAVGHPLGQADVCTEQSLAAAFEDSGGHIPSLLLAIATSDAFRYRRITD